MMTPLIYAYGRVVNREPKIVELRNRPIFKFAIACTWKYKGKEISQMYGVNSRVFDPRVEVGVSVIVHGRHRKNTFNGKSYDNIDAIHLEVPNIGMPPGKRSFSLSKYSLPKVEGEWDVIMADEGEDELDLDPISPMRGVDF